MQSFPHNYRVQAVAEPETEVSVLSSGLPTLATAAPAEFGGPGDRWSPETLLVAAVANCFILTFRAMARASKLGWQELDCQVTGVLDRVERQTRFTDLHVEGRLLIGPGVEAERARRLLDKAESQCLITNSLVAETTFHCTVELVEPSVVTS